MNALQMELDAILAGDEGDEFDPLLDVGHATLLEQLEEEDTGGETTDNVQAFWRSVQADLEAELATVTPSLLVYFLEALSERRQAPPPTRR